MSIEGFRRRAAKKRSQLLRRVLAGMAKPVRIIDLGGTRGMWQRWGFTPDDGLVVTLANNHAYDSVGRDDHIRAGEYFHRENLDVRKADASVFEKYDLIFSNSMLEHLYATEYQISLAQMILASGKPYFVQVPNRNSLIDPHYPHPMAPFFGAWPRAMQARALCLSGLRGGRRMPSVESAMRRLDNYVPLRRQDLIGLFPNAVVITERTLGIPMSLVAIGPNPVPIFGK